MSGDSSALRLAILGVFLAGTVGILIELLLLGHTEGVWQLVPIGLLVAGLAVAGWHVAARSRASVLGVRWAMAGFVLSGLAGLILHYRSNVEFELEMQPGAAGLGLIWEALTGAIPALAPGAMIQLGLIGLVYTYAHPTLRASPPPAFPTER